MTVAAFKLGAWYDDGRRNVLGAPEGHRGLQFVRGPRASLVARCECGHEGAIVHHSAHLAAQRGIAA